MRPSGRTTESESAVQRNQTQCSLRALAGGTQSKDKTAFPSLSHRFRSVLCHVITWAQSSYTTLPRLPSRAAQRIDVNEQLYNTVLLCVNTDPFINLLQGMEGIAITQHGARSVCQIPCIYPEHSGVDLIVFLREHSTGK